MNTRLFAALVACALLAGPSLAQAPRAVVQATHLDPIVSATFSADGTLVVTVSEDKTVKLWHVETGRLLATYAGHPEGVLAAAIRPDNKELVTGGWGKDSWGIARDAVTGKFTHVVDNWSGGIRSLAYSEDGKLLAIGGVQNRIHVRDEKTWSGKPLAEFGSFDGGVACLAFSTFGKGQRVAAGCEDGFVRVMSAGSGTIVHTLTGGPNKKGKDGPAHPGGVTAVAYNPKGRLLATAGADGTAKIWDPMKGELLFPLKGHAGKVTGAGFVSAKLLLTTGEDGSVRFWDADTGKPADPKEKPREFKAAIRHAVVSPDGKHVLLVFGSRARLWEIDATARTIKASHPLDGLRDRGYSAAIAPDGSAIAVGCKETVALWRPAAKHPLITLKNLEGPVLGVAFSPDGKLLATVATDPKDVRSYARVYDATTGKFLDGTYLASSQTYGVALRQATADGAHLLATCGREGVGIRRIGPDGTLQDAPYKLKRPNDLQHCFAVAFSPDGKTLAAGSSGRVVVWDTSGPPPKGQKDTRGEILHDFKTTETSWLSVAFHPKEKTLAAGNSAGWGRVWNLETGETRKMLNHDPKRKEYREEDEVHGLAYSPDGNTLAMAHGKVVHLWDAAAKYEDLGALYGHTHLVRSVAFTKDGKHLMSGSGDTWEHGNGDGVVKLWEYGAKKGAILRRPACTLYSSWDAEKKEDNWAVIDHLGRYDASRGGDVPWLHFVIDNEPVALTQLKEKYYEPHLLDKILGLNPEPVRPVGAVFAPKPPPAATVTQPKKANAVTVQVPAGAGRVQVFVNDKEVAADARPKAGGAVTVDLPKNLLRGKDDKVRVVTWSPDGTVSGRGATLDLEAVEANQPKGHTPALHAIVVGVSDYKDAKLNLRFAAKDAEDIGKALEVGAKRLFGAGQVHLTVLSSSGNKGTVAATKDNIRKAFEAARGAHADDVFLVFLAGHGVALADEDLYCYLTADARSLDPKAYAKGAARNEVVTSEELVDWIKEVPALKQVMVLDTCAAGAAAVKLGQKQDVPSTQIRAVERLKDRTGFHVLMGCAADRVSYEANRFQQGLLTYSLLQGMQGAALRPDNKVNVSELFLYAWRKVPELAEDIGGVQRPVLSAPHANPFDVGELTKAERAAIPLARPRPQLLRPRLTNPATGADDLELETRVRALLDDPKTSRGAPLAYVDGADMPHAYHPVGLYEVKGAQVTVALRVRRDGEEVAKLPPITGSKADPGKLADDIAKALRDWGATVKADK